MHRVNSETFSKIEAFDLPLPARQPSFSRHAIKRICKHAADDGAEITKYVEVEKASGHLIWSVPVAQL